METYIVSSAVERGLENIGGRDASRFFKWQLLAHGGQSNRSRVCRLLDHSGQRLISTAWWLGR
jgi:hypothetical protein